MSDGEPFISEVQPLAAELLERLKAQPWAANLVVGGYVALAAHLPQGPTRRTRDIDAWWRRGTTQSERDDVISGLKTVFQAIADAHGLRFVHRQSGIESFQLHSATDRKALFSFQIGERTIELQDPIRSTRFDPMTLETLDDNLASKMNALVIRGAPRDFMDIYEASHMQQVCTTDALWDLWANKNPGASVDGARNQALRHLESIELRRPLTAVRDEQERRRVAAIRNWSREDLLA